MSSFNVKVSGAWQSARPWVRVSGVWRGASEVWVKVSGAWQKVYEYALLNTTMTEGSYSPGPDTYYGYYPPGAAGSMYTVILGLYIVEQLYDRDDGFGGTTSYIEISGFGADPGQSFFSSLSVGGASKTSASALYGYAAGVAGWQWTGTPFGMDGTGTSEVIILP